VVSDRKTWENGGKWGVTKTQRFRVGGRTVKNGEGGTEMLTSFSKEGAGGGGKTRTSSIRTERSR